MRTPLRVAMLAALVLTLFTSPTASAAPGDLDALDADIEHFTPERGVHATAVQPDGKIILGGSFYEVHGVPQRSWIARLNADGTLDTSFLNPFLNMVVRSVVVQTDGKMIIAGIFSSVGGVSRNGIARLNADGTLDMGFDPNADGGVFGATVQADGKVLLWGQFTELRPNGAATATARRYIARVNSDGTLDTGFDPSPSELVYSAVVQEDGKVLLCGQFLALRPNGAATYIMRPYIARVDTDGNLDESFNPTVDSFVYSFALQADGKVLLLGYGVARLNADGTPDPGFVAGNASGIVTTAVVQADGKIVLGGTFYTYQPTGAPTATARKSSARLNADGTLDSGFDPKADGEVYSLALQADGKVLLGGLFDTLQPNGAPAPITREKFARLLNDDATQALTAPDATQVSWQRGGTAPELMRTTFELSTDGGNSWIPLGDGTRVGVTPNWQVTGLLLPAGGQIRARGVTTGGMWNSSSGLVEEVAAFTFYTSLQQWKLVHLGNASASDLGDPDGDGMLTLAEYGLDLLPETYSTAPVSGVFQYLDGQRLGIILRRNPVHNDVTVEVQVAGFPEGLWTTVATSAFGAPFFGPGFVHEEVENSGGLTVEVSDTVNVDEAAQRFMRVRVTR